MALWWPNKLRRENKKDRQFAIAVHFQTRSKAGGSCRNSIGVNFGVTPKIERIYHEFEKKIQLKKKIYLLPKTFVLHNIMIFEFL